eukprot:6178976-Pleurochrysis_carterae.AAC.8
MSRRLASQVVREVIKEVIKEVEVVKEVKVQVPVEVRRPRLRSEPQLQVEIVPGHGACASVVIGASLAEPVRGGKGIGWTYGSGGRSAPLAPSCMRRGYGCSQRCGGAASEQCIRRRRWA